MKKEHAGGAIMTPCRFVIPSDCNRKYSDCENCTRPPLIGWRYEKKGWVRDWMPAVEGRVKVAELRNVIDRCVKKIMEIEELIEKGLEK
jgi:hypothetical protein